MKAKINEKNKALYEWIGSKVKEFRKLRNLSQAELADQMGLSRTSIANIESARQFAPLHVLWKIADLLYIGVAEILPLGNQHLSDYTLPNPPCEKDSEPKDVVNERIQEIKLLLQHYKAPFKYDGYGTQIWDADNHFVMDIRGWGRLQYLGEEKGMKVQDSMGKLVAELLNKEFAVMQKVAENF